MDEKMKYIGIRALRYCAANVLFVIVSSVTYLSLYYIAQRTTVEISEDIIRALHIGLGISAFHILQKAFIITDAYARSRYYNNGVYLKKPAFLCAKPDAGISLAVSTVFVLFFSRSFGVSSLQEWIGISRLAAHAIIYACCVLNLFITWMIALKDWCRVETDFEKTKRKRKDNALLGKYIASTVFTFPVLGYFLPIFFPTFRTLPQILLVIGSVVVPLAVGLMFVSFLLEYARAFFIRTRFLGKLKKAAEKNGYNLSKIAHPYHSIYKDFEGSSFTLQANGKIFTCKLLSGKSYGDPIYFLEEGKGVIIRHFTLRYRSLRAAPFAPNAMIWQKLPADLAQFRTYFNYAFDGEGQKILIVCPTPHTIYATGYGENKMLDVGDIFHGYMLMTGTAFLNALERDAI